MKMEMFLVAAFAVFSVALADDVDYTRIYLGAEPAVTPNGKSFAFEWNGNVWQAPIVGGVAQQLTSGPARDSRPVFTADGSRLAFMSNRDSGNKTFELELASGTIRQLTFHSELTSPVGYAADGKTLLCEALRRDVTAEGCGIVLELVSTERRAPERVLFPAEASEGAMSPDGTKVLFIRHGIDVYRHVHPGTAASEAGELWMYDLATKEFRQLVEGAEDSQSPIWTPDGKGFYYLATCGGVRNVHYRRLDGGGHRVVTAFTDDNVRDQSVSVDGRTMVVCQGFDFWRLDPTAETPKCERIVLHPPEGYQSRPPIRRRCYSAIWNNDVRGCLSFTDKARQLAFTAGGSLWVMDTVMRRPVRVDGDSRSHKRDCSFAPDAQTIFYTSDHGDGTDIWKATRADASLAWWEQSDFIRTRVTGGDCVRRMFSLSPDAGKMAWIDNRGKLYVADTNACIIATGLDCQSCGGYAWSPDGRWIVQSMADVGGNREIWIFSTDGKGKPYNLSRNWRSDYNPAWSPDGRLIAWESTMPQGGDAIAYVYLDPSDEQRDGVDAKLLRARQKLLDEKPKKRDGLKEIVWDGLFERVRRVAIAGTQPMFGPDSRTLAFNRGGQLMTIRIPDELTPKKKLDRGGIPVEWTDDGLCRMVDSKPAVNNDVLDFTVYDETNIADYQELAFRTGWTRLRDVFYDAKFHGADWPAMEQKYVGYARNAPSWSVFARVMRMMMGELDASHLGFNETDSSRREWRPELSLHGWRPFTAHLGLSFDPEWRGDGWKVSGIVPKGPADNVRVGIVPGDVVETVDGKPVNPDLDPTEVLNGPFPRLVSLGVRSGTNAVRKVTYAAASYSQIGELTFDALLASRRRRVHEATDGKVGYIYVSKMANSEFEKFRQELFAEGMGRDAIIIDVRDNRGGHTADKMLSLLCGPDHAYMASRTTGPGYLYSYWNGPVWTKGVVALCNEGSHSNAEIFSHAMKTLKRGKLVGTPTPGWVIATSDYNLYDLGELRSPYIGVYTKSGTDMELNGAVPDIIVGITPADVANGRDPQLEAAIKAALE